MKEYFCNTVIPPRNKNNVERWAITKLKLLQSNQSSISLLENEFKWNQE